MTRFTFYVNKKSRVSKSREKKHDEINSFMWVAALVEDYCDKRPYISLAYIHH